MNGRSLSTSGSSPNRFNHIPLGIPQQRRHRPHPSSISRKGILKKILSRPIEPLLLGKLHPGQKGLSGQLVNVFMTFSFCMGHNNGNLISGKTHIMIQKTLPALDFYKRSNCPQKAVRTDRYPPPIDPISASITLTVNFITMPFLSLSNPGTLREESVVRVQ